MGYNLNASLQALFLNPITTEYYALILLLNTGGLVVPDLKLIIVVGWGQGFLVMVWSTVFLFAPAFR